MDKDDLLRPKHSKQGVKHDQGKPRVDLVPPGAILKVAAVLADGAKEYGDHNWRGGIAYSRLYAATQRHLLVFWLGEDIDNSGHEALAHACTDIMMLMEMSSEWDDRYLKPAQENKYPGKEKKRKASGTGHWPEYIPAGMQPTRE